MSEQATLNAQAELVEPSTNGASPSEARMNVRDLADGQTVAAVFAVRERERRQKRDGGEWLRLVVGDRTGTLEAVAWDGVDECFGATAPGTVVHITGRFGVHPKYGSKITIDAVRPAEPDEYRTDELA